MIVFQRKYNRMFLNSARDAIEKYKMIQNGDRIAVGLSGGKDSITLLFILSLIRQSSYKDFEIAGINIDLGFEIDMSPLEKFCSENEIRFICEKTNIGEVIFQDRKEKNPCSLCSKLRKGALYRVANREGYNKVALGHSSDDAIETFFMNMFSVGRLGTFHPCAGMEKKGITTIRPMIYLDEDTIKLVAQRENLPIIETKCPTAGKTMRQDMKELVLKLKEDYPDINKKMITSFENVDLDRLWKQRR